MKKYFNKFQNLSVPVLLLVFSLGCGKDSANILTSTSAQAADSYTELETANPEGFVEAYIILAKDYRVRSFTRDMTDGPRITVDGRLYYYPRTKLPCGRDLTVVGEDGGMAILKLSCDGGAASASLPANSGSLPEGSVRADVIFAKDYRVRFFTEDMTDGPRITVDGRLYYYPRTKLPCGRDLTVIGEDGGRSIMKLSCL
ncbi:MAG: hypothetical protein V1794_10740 [Candidatus Glassbacteria bacterium]